MVVHSNLIFLYVFCCILQIFGFFLVAHIGYTAFRSLKAFVQYIGVCIFITGEQSIYIYMYMCRRILNHNWDDLIRDTIFIEVHL